MVETSIARICVRRLRLCDPACEQQARPSLRDSVLAQLPAATLRSADDTEKAIVERIKKYHQNVNAVRDHYKVCSPLLCLVSLSAWVLFVIPICAP